MLYFHAPTTYLAAATIYWKSVDMAAVFYNQTNKSVGDRTVQVAVKIGGSQTIIY